MAETNTPPLAPPLSTDKLYEQLNANIRATDDISGDPRRSAGLVVRPHPSRRSLS